MELILAVLHNGIELFITEKVSDKSHVRILI